MRRLLVIGAVTAVASGCGSSSHSGSLDRRVANAYVDAQARALCLMQTTAYPSQHEQEAAYNHALRSSKLSAAELKQADVEAAKDEALRQRVSDKVVARCG
jgi:hypothetical protein